MKLPSWPDPIGYRNIEFGLSRIKNLLERINNPHQKLPPTIHVAGTNGKGSTIAFLNSILTKQGFKTHIYTSPHLVDFNERIILAGTQISDDFLNECLTICKKACEIEPKITPTFFEGITAAAFLAFSKINADFLLLETGMGGRLDATNVIEKNLCTIITPISFDHTEFLGDNLAKIAFEKASIIKQNSPTFISRQEPEALEVIKNMAKKMKSKTIIFGKDFKIEKAKNSWNFLQKNHSFKYFNQKWHKILKLPSIGLSGKHQIDNAATAISVALNISITQKSTIIDKIKNLCKLKILAFKKENIILAISKTKWPARLENIDYGRFFKRKKSNFEIFLDGSHNLAGAKTLYEFLNNHKNKKRFVIFAMLKDKNCKGFLNEIKNEVDFLIAIPIENEAKTLAPQKISEIAHDLKIKNSIAQNLDDAFAKINSLQINDDALILVCGSLYLAGDFLTQNKL